MAAWGQDAMGSLPPQTASQQVFFQSSTAVQNCTYDGKEILMLCHSYFIFSPSIFTLKTKTFIIPGTLKPQTGLMWQLAKLGGTGISLPYYPCAAVDAAAVLHVKTRLASLKHHGPVKALEEKPERRICHRSSLEQSQAGLDTTVWWLR